MDDIPSRSSPEVTPSGDARGRILDVATRLLAEGGRGALTTRAVAAAAGVQQPTLYRLFGDKGALLDAAAEAGLAAYVAAKAAADPDPDPVSDFRAGWDRHVGFGLANPALFSIIWGSPDPERPSPAAAAGQAALRHKVRALARAGMLRVGEARAARLAHAACTGVVLAMLSEPECERDPNIAVAAREMVVAAIVYAAPAVPRPGPDTAAIALRASLDRVASLTPGERHLLGELLDRIASQPPRG